MKDLKVIFKGMGPHGVDLTFGLDLSYQVNSVDDGIQLWEKKYHGSAIVDYWIDIAGIDEIRANAEKVDKQLEFPNQH